MSRFLIHRLITERSEEPLEALHRKASSNRMIPKNQLSQREWDDVQASLPRGSQVRGRVQSVRTFGVFVDMGLDPQIPVLLEIIHFKVVEDQPEHRIFSPEDYPKVGDEITARILAYSMKPHDIRLTQLSHLDWIHSRWLRTQAGFINVDDCRNESL